MPRTSTPLPFETVADVLDKLGGIAPDRVRIDPPPGRATENDLIRLNERTNRLYELVDGVLVEKVMGFSESSLACDLIRLLGNFVVENQLGNISGPDGSLRLLPGLVRIADVAFVRKEKLPGGRRPREAVAGLVPDLAVEVLSPGNTRGEIERKLREYFLSGVELVWLVDQTRRQVTVYTAPDQSSVYREGQTLEGGDVLPGLVLPVEEVFAEVPVEDARRRKKGRGKRGRLGE